MIRKKGVDRTVKPAKRRLAIAKRKNVILDDDPSAVTITHHTIPTEERNDLRVLRNDWYLIEAAYATDGIIVTRDRRFEDAWNRQKHRFHPPRELTFINPERDGIGAIRQLS